MPLRRAEHPWIYPVNVERHRLARALGELFSVRSFSRVRPDIATPYRLKTHESLLLRRLEGVDQRLQINKTTNLKLAAANLDGQVIRPGETFSFWRAIGRPTARGGYLTGLLLADGAAVEGVGGGLCQLANLLYWLALHSPLTVTERHHHSLDVFPDSGRVLPFGSGASVFYNYIDLQFRNDTKLTFRFRVWVDDEHLRGELLADEFPELAYHVEERDHHFYQDESGVWWRENRLWQIAVDRTSGERLGEKLIVHNVSKVLYPIERD
jgi:vancomycin resistance protein VanW